MHKKLEINWIKIKGGCQSGRKVVTNNSKSDLPLGAGIRVTLRPLSMNTNMCGKKVIEYFEVR